MSIHGQTTLVFGAGLSVEFKYPSGMDLIQAVFDKLKEDKFNKPVVDKIKYAGFHSVDRFLKVHADLEHEIKPLILRLLYEAELEDHLYKKLENSYNVLCSRLDEVDFNNFKIITFNYDRSFEYFLFNYLSYTNRSDRQIREIFEKLGIHHVHGRLHYLPCERKIYADKNIELVFDYQQVQEIRQRIKNNQDAKHKLEDFEVKLSTFAIQNILTVHQNDVNSAHSNIIQKIIRESKKVVFLGFSFDQDNMNYLGYKQFSSLSDQTVVGTSYNMKKVYKYKTEKSYPFLDLKDVTCLDFLTNYYDLVEGNFLIE